VKHSTLAWLCTAAIGLAACEEDYVPYTPTDADRAAADASAGESTDESGETIDDDDESEKDAGARDSGTKSDAGAATRVDGGVDAGGAARPEDGGAAPGTGLPALPGLEDLGNLLFGDGGLLSPPPAAPADASEPASP
jgi:hypothetical protein